MRPVLFGNHQVFSGDIAAGIHHSLFCFFLTKFSIVEGFSEGSAGTQSVC